MIVIVKKLMIEDVIVNNRNKEGKNVYENMKYCVLKVIGEIN